MSNALHLEKFIRRIEVSGVLTLKTALHIGTSAVTEAVASTDMQVIKTISGAPYIPGSSLKGVSRSFIETLLGGIKNNARTATKNTYEYLSCNIADEKQNCISKDDISRIKKQTGYENTIMEKVCCVCKLFGSNCASSKIKFLDMPVTSWAEKFEKRDGVVMDRENEVAAAMKKYDFEAVPAGTQFAFNTSIENYEDYEAGLLFIIIENINNGSIHLGGKTSRGLGRCEVTIDQIKITTAENILKRSESRVIKAHIENAETNSVEINDVKKDEEKIYNENAYEALKKILTDCPPLKSSEASSKLPELMKKYNWNKEKLAAEKLGKSWQDFFDKAAKNKHIKYENNFMIPILTPAADLAEPVKKEIPKSELEIFIEEKLNSIKNILPETEA